MARTGFLILCMATSALLSACGQKPRIGEVPESQQNLRVISAAYVKATQALGRPPANENELIPHIKAVGADPAKVLVSPNDGQKYVILWGVDFLAPKTPVFAYEQTGKDGKRFVSRFREVSHVTSEELRKMPFPPGKAPP